MCRSPLQHGKITKIIEAGRVESAMTGSIYILYTGPVLALCESCGSPAMAGLKPFCYCTQWSTSLRTLTVSVQSQETGSLCVRKCRLPSMRWIYRETKRSGQWGTDLHYSMLKVDCTITERWDTERQCGTVSKSIAFTLCSAQGELRTRELATEFNSPTNHATLEGGAQVFE